MTRDSFEIAAVARSAGFEFLLAHATWGLRPRLYAVAAFGGFLLIEPSE
jgi:hypothetical protein